MALMLADIDLENAVISVTKTYSRMNSRDIITSSKTQSSARKVSMPAFLVDEIKEYIGLLHKPKKD